MSASSGFIVPIVNPFSLINIHSRYIDWRLYSITMSLVYGNTGLDRKSFIFCIYTLIRVSAAYIYIFMFIHILYFTPGYRFYLLLLVISSPFNTL